MNIITYPCLLDDASLWSPLLCLIPLYNIEVWTIESMIKWTSILPTMDASERTWIALDCISNVHIVSSVCMKDAEHMAYHCSRFINKQRELMR